MLTDKGCGNFMPITELKKSPGNGAVNFFL